jgi:hypothetical protein
MKSVKTLLCLGTLALGVVSAESRYNLTLSSSTWVGQTELKPGDYKVEMQGDKAVFKTGKSVVEVPAAIVNGSQKYQVTAVETGAGSKMTEIHLGGTTTKIVLKSAESAAAGN